MRLRVLAFAVMLAVSPDAAQAGRVSAMEAAAQAASAPSAPPGDNAPPAGTPREDLPVSLDRIREGLARPESRLRRVDLKPDFIVHIEERDHIISILSKLQVPPSSPFPAGGLYGYEQQRMAFPKSSYPLMQPYAAFSGGELITLAIEGIAQRYLKQTVGKVVSGAIRERAERSAREEVAAAIADYCDTQPDGGQALHLCIDVLDR